MNTDTRAAIQALVDSEARAGLEQILRNARRALTTGLPASSRVYYEVLRDAAIARLDAMSLRDAAIARLDAISAEGSEA